jgi:hypothetical protein
MLFEEALSNSSMPKAAHAKPSLPEMMAASSCASQRLVCHLEPANTLFLTPKLCFENVKANSCVPHLVSVAGYIIEYEKRSNAYTTVQAHVGQQEVRCEDKK